VGYSLDLFQTAYIVGRFYGGASLRRICLDFRNDFSFPISASTSLRLIVVKTKTAYEAVDHLMKMERLSPTQKSGFSPILGDIWEIDEIWLPLGRENFPLIVVKDLKTCFFPAANPARASSIETTTEALVCARNIARKCPVELRGDGNPAYKKAVRRAFGHKTKLTVHKKIGPMSQDQSIEGTFGAAVRNRIKGMRSLHSWEVSPTIIKGMVLDYHFARPCEALIGKTPAEAAMTWNPLDGKRGWPALLRLAEYYERTRLSLKKQVQVYSKIHRQITFDELPIVDKRLIGKDGPLTCDRNKQLQLSSFLT
jgi:hypothetical protein